MKKKWTQLYILIGSIAIVISAAACTCIIKQTTVTTVNRTLLIQETDITPEHASIKILPNVPVNQQLKPTETTVIPVRYDIADCIFVGDSRTVGMSDIIDDNATVIAKTGQGYDWLVNTADNTIRAALQDKTVLFFNLGVNDLDNADKYIDYLHSLQSDFPTLQIFYISINPVKNTVVTNAQIEAFNKKVCNAGFSFIDINTYLQTTGFQTTDGLHYTAETSARIYHRILDTVGIS